MSRHCTDFEPIRAGRTAATALIGRAAGILLRHEKRGGWWDRSLRALDRLASPRISDLEPLGDSRKRSEVESVLKRTALWHGTGRYQYRDGEQVDALELILQRGSLQPSYDPFDTTGDMNTISLAHSRVYARSYADMHLNRDESRPERHGSARFWATMILADYALESANEMGSLRKAGAHVKSKGSGNWHSKVSRRKQSVLETFHRGSDIPGNYPILFGVNSVHGVETSRAIAIHEVRTCESIDMLTQVTHLEVPRGKIDDIRRILDRHGLTELPVFAIEDFERYAAEQPLSELISPRK